MSEQAKEASKPVTTHPAVVGEPCEVIPGQPYLKFKCPGCGVVMGLSGGRHHICHCGASVEVKAPDGAK